MSSLDEKLDEKATGMSKAYGLLFTEEDRIIYAPFLPRNRPDEFFRIEEKLLVEDFQSGTPILYLELDNEKDEVYYSTNEEVAVHNSELWIDEDGYAEDMGDTFYFELRSLFNDEIFEMGGPLELILNKQVLLPGGSSLGCENLYFLDLDGRKIDGTKSGKRISEVILLDYNEKYAHVAYARSFDLDKNDLNRIYTARIELAKGTAKTRSLIREIDDWGILMKLVESEVIDLRLRRRARLLKQIE
ncbi:MAG: hypothetical protein NTZ02_01825 [Candidatus Woesearchaeota archaeon]|nr:hypothetical protein [Candidatus Woesearchaeota archaeon]